MRWVRKLSSEVDETADVIGGKAIGLVTLLRLGLPVPPAFVVSTEACQAFLVTERFPDGLADELTAVAELGRNVSVRSGAAVSMPGMMNTVLDVEPVPEKLIPAVEAVFSSWHTSRARTYRELHGIPHDLGTAVVVQAMVYGNRDEHSGAGVAFSRDPNTGAPVPYGEFLFGRHGEDVVSGRSVTLPLRDLEPLVWNDLVAALNRVEAHYRDACYLEFTFEAGKLWLLQARPGRFTGRAAVRVAVDLADAGTIPRAEALRRISPQDLEDARTPRISPTEILARGTGASPGVATGRMATTAEAAVRMAAAGPVILVRPETSPLDMNGLAAATGVVTARGGPVSHAAVVARAMRKPAVVGATAITIDGTVVRVGERTLPEGTVITIDGTGGEVVTGSAPITTADSDPHLRRLLEWRLLT
jgi:pyruvate,orthophosphate dikinase